ncbi:MAG TPA: hypothetical protein VE046_06295 [Steroidobacteraceae bacterium]|nr:hypothetical protein [Steroidobacteraceae bacterium]
MTEPLSEWLRVMLDEIARKRADAERAGTEARARAAEQPAAVRPAKRGDASSRKS